MSFECPVEDCSYTAPTEASIGGHYQAMKDGKHPGGRQKALELLQGGASASEGNAQVEAQEPREEPSEAVSGGRGSDPTMGSAEPQRQPQPQAQSRQHGQQQGQRQAQPGRLEEGVDEPTCQRCGGELYDFRQFESGRYHRVNGQQVYVAGDFQCSSCAKWWDWREDL